MTPLIMKLVVREVLDQDPRLTAAVIPYADDLLVNETIVSSAEVVRHFARFGLACKPLERAADGARMLGLRAEKDPDGVLQWKRDGETPDDQCSFERGSTPPTCPSGVAMTGRRVAEKVG